MKESITVDVARTFDEIIQSVAIRSAVYIGEAGWNFSEEWDGNDFSATHLLCKVDGNSAGSLRIRYFADFVKFERLAVLPQFRGKRFGQKGVAFALCDAGVEFCLKKGFTRFYGHALKDLVPFWSKVGRGMMKPLHDEAFECSGKTVVPMFGEMPGRNDRLSIDSGHYVLVRREGEWDTPGFWETAHVAS